MLADTSAWVEYLRGTGSATHVALRAGVEAGEVWITEPVVLEVLQGGRSESHVRSLQGLLWRARLLAVDSADYAEAAFLHRVCRANGVTVRSSLDCLIAAVSIRTGVPVLHHDRDFDVLAAHTPLVAQRG